MASGMHSIRQEVTARRDQLDDVVDRGEEVNPRIHKGKAIWHSNSSWCVATEASETVCTRSSEIPFCGSERGEELWLDADSFVLCSCSPGGVVCARMDQPDHVGYTEDFLVKMCVGNAGWYDGRKWCICVNNTPRGQVDVHCVKSVRDRQASATCSWMSVSENRRQVCACSGTSGSCVAKRLSDNNVARKRRQRRWVRRWRPQIASTAAGCGGRSVGTRWTDGCNVCVCSNAGVAMCTAKHCRLEYDNLKTG